MVLRYPLKEIETICQNQHFEEIDFQKKSPCGHGEQTIITSKKLISKKKILF